MFIIGNPNPSNSFYEGISFEDLPWFCSKDYLLKQ